MGGRPVTRIDPDGLIDVTIDEVATILGGGGGGAGAAARAGAAGLGAPLVRPVVIAGCVVAAGGAIYCQFDREGCAAAAENLLNRRPGSLSPGARPMLSEGGDRFKGGKQGD